MKDLTRRVCAGLSVVLCVFSLGLNLAIQADGASPEGDLVLRAAQALRQNRAGKGKGQEFSLTKVGRDHVGKSHARFRQVVDDVPVWGGEAIVHLNEDGSVNSVTDDFKSDVEVNTRPAFSLSQAVEIAMNLHRGAISREPIADVWIFRGKDRDHLAYRVQVEKIDGTKETSMPVYFIDAESGEVVSEYDNFQTATGESHYSGTVGFDTALYRRVYYLEDLTRNIGTFDYANSAFGGYPTRRFTDSDNKWFSGGSQTAAIDAHWGAIKVNDYYRDVFARNGIDGNGGPGVNTSITSKRKKLITSGVHYSTDFVNAGWTGDFMLYGDGDGIQSGPLTTLDIVAHEFTHGVTQYEAGLIYTGESGALNEGISDIFGSVIESRSYGSSKNTWMIGEDCWTPAVAGDALRHMDEPHRASNKGFTADDDPDHYSERYTGSGDNGGVHINSGIVNKQFYLLANGGTHHLGGEMAGIGTDRAAAIWYYALTNYMTSSTNFSGARTATINAANSLYGQDSAEAAAVAQAWSLVGVY